MQRARHGRPRSTRIRTEMDMREQGQPKRCSLCKSVGHTRRACPNRGSTSGGSSQHQYFFFLNQHCIISCIICSMF